MFGWWTNITLEDEELRGVPEDVSSLHLRLAPGPAAKGDGVGQRQSVTPSVCPVLRLGQQSRVYGLQSVVVCVVLLCILASVPFLYQSSFVLSAAFHASSLELGVIYVCKEDRWVTCHK